MRPKARATYYGRGVLHRVLRTESPAPGAKTVVSRRTTLRGRDEPLMEQAPQLDAPTVSALENTASGLTKILKAVRKHWPIAIACITLAMGISVLFTKSQRKVYGTQSLVEIDSEPHAQYLGDKTRGVNDIGDDYFDGATYIQTQHRIIVSDKILGVVVSTLGLASDPDFGGHLGTPAPNDVAATILRSHVKV